MSERSAISVLLTGLAALLLAAPASGQAAEPPASTPTAPPATTPSTPTSEAPPSAGTGSSGTSTPAPAPPTTAETTVTVPGWRPQGSAPSTHSRPGHKPGSAKQGSPKAGARKGAKHPAKGSSPTAGSPPRGPRAPAPSALTPPLPLAFSSSLGSVPGFFIESFRVPPFLLPIYQAAGTAYGVPWQVLAAINEVETDYGRDLSVSSAGAEGWMQFLPSSWATYGVDANGDGFKDPYNPADAIFAAGRYLRAAGAATNLRAAIYAYNHSQAYVESVILRAKLLGGTPSELLGAVTGLTESRFPVHAPSYFSDGFQQQPGAGPHGPTTIVGTTIYSQPGAPVIAVQDGRITQIGRSPELGRFISLRDAYGNSYTYAQLGRVAALYPVLKPHEGASSKTRAPSREAPEPRPTGPATAGTQPTPAPAAIEDAGAPAQALELPGGLPATPAPGSPPTAVSPSAAGPSAGSAAAPPVLAPTAPPAPSHGAPRVFRAGPNDVYLHPLRRGVTVIAGTVLGHVGRGSGGARATVSAEGQPHMLFQIRPAGVGAPLIDPKPILDGWVSLENSSLFRAKGANPYLATAPAPGQVLLESKQQLEQQVRANGGIEIHGCGREDVQTGQVDRRVLATLEYLAVSGLKPTVSAMSCAQPPLIGGPGALRESAGDAFDISAVNGIKIAGHHGPGSITDTTVRKLLTLQGSMKPHQIISPIHYPGTDNTRASAAHPDRVHVAFEPLVAVSGRGGGAFSASVSPSQWIQLIARLGEIPNPRVERGPSAASIPDHPSAPPASEREPGGHH